MTGASSYEDREETARREAECRATERRAMGQCSHGLPPSMCPDCRPEPPPADTSWLVMTSSRARPAGYVWRPSDARPAHQCDLPAEWEDGAVWRCPLGHLWVVRLGVNPYRRGYAAVGLEWTPAGWWMRRRHGGRRARVEMANENRRKTARTMKPPPRMPKAPGGVSGPPRGLDSLPVPPPQVSTPGTPKDFDG